jgi:hypothetical protein
MTNIHVVLNSANRQYEKQKGVFYRNDCDEMAYIETRKGRQVSCMFGLSECCRLTPAGTVHSGEFILSADVTRTS